MSRINNVDYLKSLFDRIAKQVAVFSPTGAAQVAEASQLPRCELEGGVYGLLCFVIDYDVFLDDKLWPDAQAFLDSDDYYKSEALELRQQQEKLRKKINPHN
uniref:hypothetical protein n=1 Tax=Vaginimicrobium propionicum TaxID=1871034 RepID=UPI00097037DB|nr:hypothetical protein [Vaginimicrobium propionicum]